MHMLVLLRGLFRLLVVCLLCSGVMADPLAGQNRTYVLGVHPYLPLTELKKRYEPLAAYLKDALGAEVVVRIGSDYEEHLARVGADEIDIAYLGPAGYVRMVENYGQKPLLARIETRDRPVFNGYLVKRMDSDVTDIASLKGKRFAFGDPASTMSHLIPRYMLLEAGIRLEDLGNHAFLGSHTNVAIGVLRGDYDAGAVKGEVLAAYWNQGLRAFAKSEPFSEHVFVARADAEPAFLKAVTRALYGLSGTPKGRAILSGLKKGVTGMVPAQDQDYDNLRNVINSLSDQLGG
jgi:phosphonate transport system substrate-binding protein